METLFDISVMWPLFSTLTSELSLVVLCLFISFVLKKESNRYYFVGLLIALFPLSMAATYLYFYVDDTQKLKHGDYLEVAGKLYSFDSDGNRRIGFWVGGEYFSCQNYTFWNTPTYDSCSELKNLDNVKILFVPGEKHGTSPPQNLVLKLMHGN